LLTLSQIQATVNVPKSNRPAQGPDLDQGVVLQVRRHQPLTRVEAAVVVDSLLTVGDAQRSWLKIMSLRHIDRQQC
jgi:hypothetical protein